MALENALIAKIAGGVAVTGGTVGLGVAFKDNIANWFKTNSHSYLIVKATSDTSSQPTEENLKHGKDKNYECKIKDIDSAVDCEIVEVKFHDTNKTVDIDTLNNLNADKDINKNVFSSATDKYFKLKIDKSHFSHINITDASPKTIDIVVKNPSTADKEKKHATLTPEFQVLDGLVTTKSKDLLLAVKVPSANGSDVDNTFNNYKCISGDVLTSSSSCDLYKVTGDNVTDNTDLKTVNLSTLSTTKISNNTEILENKLRVIKVANVSSSKLNKYWKSENIKFASYSNTSENKDKKSWNFTVISRLYGDVANPTKGFFILEK